MTRGKVEKMYGLVEHGISIYPSGKLMKNQKLATGMRKNEISAYDCGTDLPIQKVPGVHLPELVGF